MIGQPKGRLIIVKKPKSCLHSVRHSDFHSQSGFSSQNKKKQGCNGFDVPTPCCVTLPFSISISKMGSVVSFFRTQIPSGEEHERCRKALMNRGAGVNILDQRGLTPLMFAAKEGHAQCVNKLIKAGAHVNIDGW